MIMGALVLGLAIGMLLGVWLTHGNAWEAGYRSGRADERNLKSRLQVIKGGRL